MIQNITKNRTIAYSLLSVLGVILVAITYWFFHPVYARNFSELPNAKLAVILISLLISIGLYLNSAKRDIRGWKIYALIFALQFISLSVYIRSTEGIILTMKDILPFMAYSFILQAIFVLILLIMFGLGDWAVKKLDKDISDNSTPMLAVVIGIALFSIPLFFLGIAGLLTWWSLWPLLAIIFVWRIKTIVQGIKQLLFHKITYSPGSYVQVLSVLGILLFISISFIRSVKLFPLGFDGVSVYMNISHLIATSSELPSGFSAFNWSLFMAIGEILTGWESMSIAISHFIVVPVILYLTYFAKEVFNLKYYWLPSLIFLLIPATGYHILLDEKIDLGFLFVVLGIIHLSYLLWKPKIQDSRNNVNKTDWKALALLGLLLGYAIGIKYLGFFVAISVASMWLYSIGGWRIVAGLSLTAVGFFFFTGAYRLAYLELGQNSPYLIGAIPFSLGFVLMGISVFRKWQNYKAQLKGGITLVLFTLISLSPWIFKNLAENKNITLESMLFGKPDQQRIEQKDLIYRLDRIIEISSLIKLQGIDLDQMQLAKLAEYLRTVLDYSLKSLRPFITDTLLRPEQSAAIKLRTTFNESNDMVQIRSKIIERMKRFLTKQDILLDETQQTTLKQIIAFIPPEVIKRELNGEASQNLKIEIINKLLTPSQKEKLEKRQVKYLNENNKGISGAQYEEIKRYIGYDKGLSLYLSLPFDLTMNTNIPDTRYLDISFLFIIWLGLLVISSSLWKTIAGTILLIGLWIFSISSQYFEWLKSNTSSSPSDYLNSITVNFSDTLSQVLKWLFLLFNQPLLWIGINFQDVYNKLSDFSFGWTIVCIIVLAAILFGLSKSRLSHYSSNQKMLLTFSGVYTIFWFLFGNGIVWYTFPAMAIVIPAIIQHAQNDAELKGLKWIPYLPLTLFILMNLTLPFSIYNNQSDTNRSLIFTDSFISAAGRFQEKEATFPYFLPFMKESLEVINSDDNAKVYRVGTFFNYHITRNNERVIEDNQLELFSNAIRDFKDKSVFVPLLYENGIRYVLFDLNIGTMDRTPDKSLVTKANEFIRIISNSHKAELLYTDNIIPDPSGGTVDLGREIISGKPGFSDTTLRQGSYVLFKINP